MGEQCGPIREDHGNNNSILCNLSVNVFSKHSLLYSFVKEGARNKKCVLYTYESFTDCFFFYSCVLHMESVTQKKNSSMIYIGLGDAMECVHSHLLFHYT